MSAWVRHPLTDQDLVAIDRTKWRVFPRDTVVEIAEGWNAGLTTAAMAADLQCRPGSLRVLIGKLTQIGVDMRRAPEAATLAQRAADRTRSPLAQAMAAEQFARLQRVAKWDPAAARALDLYRRGRGA